MTVTLLDAEVIPVAHIDYLSDEKEGFAVHLKSGETVYCTTYNKRSTYYRAMADVQRCYRRVKEALELYHKTELNGVY